jgi:Fe2+ or Zn2+ uptake regulation protein
MNGFGSAWIEHLRIAILRLLNSTNGYGATESLLHDALRGPDLRFGVSRDQVRAQMAWLAEQGLVTIDVSDAGKYAAVLTSRGQDVAEGLAEHPGVKRPRAGA